jgi:hypothetical protein
MSLIFHESVSLYLHQIEISFLLQDSQLLTLTQGLMGRFPDL